MKIRFDCLSIAAKIPYTVRLSYNDSLYARWVIKVKEKYFKIKYRAVCVCVYVCYLNAYTVICFKFKLQL